METKSVTHHAEGRARSWPPWNAVAAAAALGLVGIGLVLLSTRWGPILSDDSFAYIRMAQDIRSGASPTFVPAFPPIPQLVLAGLASLGAEPVSAFRHLNAVLFGASIFLFGVAVFIVTSSRVFFMAGSALFLLSAILIRIHAEALSEPLYLAAVLLASIGFGLYGRRASRSWLIVAALAAGAALGIRYVGLAAVAAGMATLLARRSPGWKHRVLDALLVGLSAGLLAGWYLLRNLAMFGSPTPHGAFRLDYALSLPSRQSLYGILIWFIPGRLVRGFEYEASLILLLGALGFAAVSLKAWRIQTIRIGEIVLKSLTYRFHGWFLIFSGLVLTVSQGYVRIGDTFNERYILPAYVAVLFLVMALLGAMWVRGGPRARASAIFLTVGLFGFFGYRSWKEIRTLYEEGAGYTSRRWHSSETLSYLRHHPEVPLISTAPAGLRYWLGRPVEDFSRNPVAVRAYVCDTGGWLVIIDSLPPEFYGVSTEELVSGLELVQDFSEGSIYTCNSR